MWDERASYHHFNNKQSVFFAEGRKSWLEPEKQRIDLIKGSGINSVYTWITYQLCKPSESPAPWKTVPCHSSIIKEGPAPSHLSLFLFFINSHLSKCIIVFCFLLSSSIQLAPNSAINNDFNVEVLDHCNTSNWFTNINHYFFFVAYLSDVKHPTLFNSWLLPQASSGIMSLAHAPNIHTMHHNYKRGQPLPRIKDLHWCTLLIKTAAQMIFFWIVRFE